jgi:hypothetical protein
MQTGQHIQSARTNLVSKACKAILGFVILSSLTSEAMAMDQRTYASLRRLDPDLRLEQVCDLAAMEHIGRETHKFRPDRAKSDITSHPAHLGDILQAPGAAFRSNGNWYELSFVCRASSDHLEVKAFKYEIGKMIPESQWDDYGLWR